MILMILLSVQDVCFLTMPQHEIVSWASRVPGFNVCIFSRASARGAKQTALMNGTDLGDDERLCIGAAIILDFGKRAIAYKSAAEVARTMDISGVDLEQVSPQDQVESVCLFMRAKVPEEDIASVCAGTKFNLGTKDTCRLCSPPRNQGAAGPPDPNAYQLAKAFYEGSYADPNQGVARAFNWFSNVSEHGGVKTFYSKSVAIVQSSGSGKSRLVYELAANIPTIYVCLRKPDDTGIPKGSPVDLYNLIVGRPAPRIEDRVPSKCDLWVYSCCVAFFCVANIFTVAAWNASSDM